MNWFLGKLAPQKVVTARQVHEEIYLSGDELVRQLNRQILEYRETEKGEVIVDKGLKERVAKLKRLGFSNHPDVLQYKEYERKEQEERNKLWEEKQLIEKKKKTLMLIEEFYSLYPSYKIVAYSDLQDICKKYGLQEAPVEYFTGDLPDKNLEEINRFFDMKKANKFSHIVYKDEGLYAKYEVVSTIEEWEQAEKEYEIFLNKLDERRDFNAFERYASKLELDKFRLEKREMFICCLKKDLVSNWKEKERLKELIKEDPIVFVQYEDFAIILSAWGAEAEDVNKL